MKVKTLMTMAVAGTLGLSAAAFAENAHAGFTPFSVNESGDVIAALQEHQQLSAQGSTSQEVIASAGESFSESSSVLSDSDATASLGSDDSFALADEGIYSDYYVVSWTPVMVESWELYAIDVGEPAELAAADSSDFGMPTHELAIVSDEDGNLDLALAEIPSDEASSEMASIPSSVNETA